MTATGPTPSVLDRLVDACAGIDQPQPAKIDRLIDDLENLLNTCCVPTDQALAEHPEAHASMLSYGAPAPASLAIATHAERLAAARQLRDVLRRFEPRLSRVRIAVEQADAKSNDGRFRLDAEVEGAGPLSLPIRVRTTSGRTQVTADRT